jgi:hypothetical protein
MAVSFTLLQPMLGIAHGDFRLLGHGNPFHEADVASRASLELSIECCNRGQMIFTLGGPFLSACVAYHFAAKPLLLLDLSTNSTYS